MAYKNLILRSIISLIFIIIYIIISFYEFSYIYYIIFVIYFLILIEVIKYFKEKKFYILCYLLISFVFFLFSDLSNENLIKFNLFIFIIISFDIFSYIIGKIFGKIKILPNISPKKTLEGFFGGIIFSLILSLLYSYYFNLNINSNLFIYIIIILSFSFFGDLIESYFKRKNNIKNSSNFLPGHGGFFDRFDSFLFSIIIFSISNNIE